MAQAIFERFVANLLSYIMKRHPMFQSEKIGCFGCRNRIIPDKEMYVILRNNEFP